MIRFETLSNYLEHADLPIPQRPLLEAVVMAHGTIYLFGADDAPTTRLFYLVPGVGAAIALGAEGIGVHPSYIWTTAGAAKAIGSHAQTWTPEALAVGLFTRFGPEPFYLGDPAIVPRPGSDEALRWQLGSQAAFLYSTLLLTTAGHLFPGTRIDTLTPEQLAEVETLGGRLLKGSAVSVTNGSAFAWPAEVPASPNASAASRATQEEIKAPVAKDKDDPPTGLYL
jgi:hypothetical protein